MSRTLELITSSAEETQELGRLLGSRLEVGDLVLLSGELGSGKTTLTQGMAWGVGVEEYAHSPTFVLVNQYQGRLVLHHVDLYRLDDVGEVVELGVSEMLADGACVVEWADKALEVFPSGHLRIDLAEAGPERRRLRFTATGERALQFVEEVRAFGLAH
jgi:tRNA threonylcarbamoyladenosine biosynthesis protein TsaE